MHNVRNVYSRDDGDNNVSSSAEPWLELQSPDRGNRDPRAPMLKIRYSAALKNSDALQACHSVLRNRCAFRCRANVAVDGDERRRSVGRLFHMSGPETAKFLRPMVVAVRCTLSLPEAADLRCRRPASSTTGWQSSARYGGASHRRHLLTSIAILYIIRW